LAHILRPIQKRGTMRGKRFGVVLEVEDGAREEPVEAPNTRKATTAQTAAATASRWRCFHTVPARPACRVMSAVARSWARARTV
jgi:hypothetical protein